MVADIVSTWDYGSTGSDGVQVGGVGTFVEVAVAVTVEVGVAQLETTAISTVLMSAELPLKPATMTSLLPTFVPDVHECGTFRLGPVLQVPVAMSYMCVVV